MTGYSILGDLYVVGTDHKVGTWDGTGVDDLGYLGGWQIQQLAFQSDGTMWGVSTDHSVGKWNGQGWDIDLRGWWVHQIAFAPDGTIFAVGADHNIGKWTSHGWDNLGYLGGWWIDQILFGPDGTMWCVSTSHKVGKWNGNGWDDQGRPGGWQILQLLFDAEGTMWCVGTEYNIGKWNGSGWNNLRPTIITKDVVWIAWRPPQNAAAFDNWTAPIASPGVSACLAYGTVWQGSGGTLCGFDHFTGKQTYAIGPFGAAHDVRKVQPYDDGLLVFASDGYLYKASLTAHARPTRVAYVEADPSWMEAYRGSVYLASKTNGLQRVPPPSEDFQATSPGWITLPYGEGYVVGEPKIGEGYLLVPMQYKQVDAVDAATLKGLWSVAWGAGSLSVVLPQQQTTFNGENFCVATDAVTVSVISVSQRKLAWTKSFAAELSAQPVCDLNYCCVSLKTGQLLVLSVSDGQLVKTITLPGIYDRLILEDGTLYGVLDQYGYNSILPLDVSKSAFAVDIATGAVATVRTTSRPSLIAVENRVPYYRTLDAVFASRLGKLVRTFYAEATLLQDFDFNGDASASPKPMINTEIVLFKDDGTPQPRQHVRVGATAPATIESGGETYSIGPSAYATIPTDATGRLRIAMRAGEADEQNNFRDGLTTPALTLFTTFMGSDHRILIRPDAQLHDKLAGMKTDTLAKAVGYDGQPILSAKYRDRTDAVGSAAQMITATMSMVKTSVDQKNRRRATRDDYLAPGCDTAVICCCHHDDYAVPMVCTSTFAFDLDRATFKDKLDEHETQQWLDALQATGPVTRGLGDWLLNAIKNGTAALKAAVVQAGKVGSAVAARLTAVINGAARVFDIVLETIEQAITMVHGVFNEIVESVGKVLQAFSFAFSWPAIVDLKDQIKANITGSWDAVLTGTPSQYDLVASAALTEIDTFRETADQTFKQIKAQFGGKSIAGERKQAIGDKNPAAGGSTDNWLQSKLSDNFLSERALQQAGGPARSATIPIVIPDFTVPDSVIEDLQGLIPRLGRLVTKDTELLFQRLSGDLAPEPGLDVFAASVSAIVDIIHGAVDIAIDLAREAPATLFRIIKSVLTAAREFVDKEIQIPFISDLYRSVVHSPLTILDLSALLIAVPSSLAIAALTFNDRHAELTPRDLGGLSSRVTGQILFGIVAGVAQVIWAAISTGLELFNLVVERKVAIAWVEQFASKLNAFFLIIGLVAVRGAFLVSEVLEATDRAKKTDWSRVAKLWLPATLAAAIDVVATVAKARVLAQPDSTDHEKLLKFLPYFSAVGGFICGFADFLLASKTLATQPGTKGQNWDYYAHLSEDLSLFVRPGVLLAEKLPGAVYAQAGLIGLSSLCLATSGALKIVASSPGIHERGAMA